ncbi:DUF2975 domain-containing protein [Pelagicoccus sp. SDUM812003]|uniref:DUF2975 domain-containing protein n=1 Tax=Pelagicoccus sp. SDUM812003 TaxID=3041267 RepID=UPI00280E0EFB|nr:DUF2975 domain-containing protein [Pelagicoccus sp. SDUM812003]MDQ8205094.1 DUF2975 domain-containing protein [Pelagicoccus sp. SDUM812003]
MILFLLAISVEVLASDGSSAEISYFAAASNVDTSGLKVFDKDGREGRVSFEEGTVLMFHFPLDSLEVKVRMMVLALFFAAIVLALFLPLVKQLREIMKTVYAGDPFVESNAKRVRWIGLILIIATFAEAISELVVYGYADATFVTKGFDLDGRLSLDFIQLIAGMCVLVLSEVFRQGTRMREEQELTV